MPPQRPAKPTRIRKVDEEAAQAVAVDNISNDDVDSNGDSKGEVLRPGSIGGLKTYSPSALKLAYPYTNVLIYGEGGIGKTHLAASASKVPALSPVLVLNVEEGAKTIAGAYEDNVDIDVVTPRTFGKIQSIFDDLFAQRGSVYKTVVFDNATEGQKVGIEYIFDGDKQSTDFTEFMDASWSGGSWNRSSEQMRKLIRYFRVLPMHKIFLAWRKDYAKDEKKERWGPAFSKSLAGEIPGMFDDVFYYYWANVNNEQTRVLLTQGSANAVAKSRANGVPLPKTIQAPTMAKLCELWGIK
jgi:hypothetical protein